MQHSSNKKTLSRRAFLKKGSLAGLGILAAGVLGGLHTSFAGLGERRAFALAEQGDLSAYKPKDRRPERPTQTALQTISNTGVRSRFALLSDAHFCTYDNAARDKLTHALETLAYYAPGLDALFMLGDVSLGGHEDELEGFATHLARTLSSLYPLPPRPIMHLIMGNHDWWSSNEQQFEHLFSAHANADFFAAKQNSVSVFDGATVIKLNGAGSYEEDTMHYTASYEFLAHALAKAAAQRPGDALLIMAHEPPDHMRLPEKIETGDYGQGTSRDMIKLIALYPQARMFSGHIHNPLDIPETVNSDLGFTSVHTSTVGSCLFVRNKLVDDDELGSQGLVLDTMEDGRLIVHLIDFAKQKHLGTPLTI